VAERRFNLNSSSKVFSPFDFGYNKELDALEKLFDEYKDNRAGDKTVKKP